ncbi:MAG: hypothetical protein FWF28_09530 [Micrococcales bacterium]|nr:hypothetical protein [Micrococcales bacterium]
MSICIDVIPSLERIPTITELVGRMTVDLAAVAPDPVVARLWADEGVTVGPPLVELVKEPSDGRPPVRRADSALRLSMDESDWGWLSMDAYKVGIDFHVIRPEACDEDWWGPLVLEDMAPRAVVDGRLAAFDFERAAAIGWRWSFRGRMGRSRARWLLAGVGAASLARLTGGCLWFNDGGADWERMPASPDTFLAWFPAWIEGEFTWYPEAGVAWA